MRREPIFIIGTERSGSNLLRSMLNAHPSITVPHPPHILHYFAPIEKRYGPLDRDENLYRLARDVLRLLGVHIHPWEIVPDIDTVMRNARPRDLFGIFAAVYDAYLAHVGKQRWGCKSTFMIHHTDRILARFPGARLIWLVRDPRDVALSSRQSVFSPYHPYFTAQLWKRQQDIGFRLVRELAPENILLVRYEGLLESPWDTVERICAFLDEPVDDSMLHYFETADARKGASLSEDWRNIASPILANNVGKFRAHLREEEIALVEQVTAETMKKLGYQPERLGPESGDVQRTDLLQYRLKNWADLVRVEWRSMRRDRNHWRRWKRGLTVRELHLRSRLRSL